MILRPALLLALFATAALAPTLAMADVFDDADITVTTYEVTGSSLSEVRSDMDANGPQGYWAFTSWWVNWSASCEVTVTGQITMPELASDADLSPDEVAEFERMNAALLAHELQHVEFGVGYADEIRTANCPSNGEALLEPWLEEERQFDADTQHGYSQGVSLDE